MTRLLPNMLPHRPHTFVPCTHRSLPVSACSSTEAGLRQVANGTFDMTSTLSSLLVSHPFRASPSLHPTWPLLSSGAHPAATRLNQAAMQSPYSLRRWRATRSKTGSRSFRQARDQVCQFSTHFMSGEADPYSLLVVVARRLRSCKRGVNHRTPQMPFLSSPRGLKPRKRRREF